MFIWNLKGILKKDTKKFLSIPSLFILRINSLRWNKLNGVQALRNALLNRKWPFWQLYQEERSSPGKFPPSITALMSDIYKIKKRIISSAKLKDGWAFRKIDQLWVTKTARVNCKVHNNELLRSGIKINSFYLLQW